METSNKTAKEIYLDVKNNPARARFGFGNKAVLVNIDPVESTLTLQNGARVRGETTRRGRGGRTRARDLREATIADDEERLTTANVGRERSAIVRNGGKTDEWGADPAERGGVRVHHV